MDVFHCNACGHLPHLAGIDHRRYFITNCGHVLCGNCAGNGNGGLKDLCGVCHIACKTCEVNQNSNPEIKAYFMDPASMLGEAYKKFGKIANFQKAQTKNFQTLITKMYDVCRRTSAENATLRKELAFSQEENQMLKAKIETIQQDHQSWIGRGSPGANVGVGGNATTFQLSLGQHVSLGEGTNSRSPAFPGGVLFTNDKTGVSTQNFFDTPSASSTTSSNQGTPLFRTPSDNANASVNVTPANRLFRSQSSIAILGGAQADRSANRTPTSCRTPREGESTPRFCPAPGAGRPRGGSRDPSPQNGTQTPDLATRLRGLRW